MVENQYTKWIVLLVLMSVTPIAYAFGMGYWLLIWMSVIDYVGTTDREVIIGLIVVGNVLGVVVTAIVVALSLKMFFKEKVHWAALGVAISIIMWSMITTTLYWNLLPDTITILEWTVLLLVLPGFGYFIQKLSSGNSEGNHA
ncbi:MAG: hypothetical protein GY951_07820 [Psychromonas sp.]|nr:hypothetical protein [Psychromonas sp.]